MMRLGAKEVPDVVWGYYDTIDFMEREPGMYHMDRMRRDWHERVAEHYRVSTNVVTEVREKSEDAVDFHFNIKKLLEEKA